MLTTNKFPKWMDEYLKENKFEIVQIPNDYRIIGEKGFPNIIIKSARQLYEHIEREGVFWTNDVVKNNHIVRSYPNQIETARNNFENALQSNDAVARKAALQRAIHNVCSCEISSKTKLAKIFVKYSMEPGQFFQGFQNAFTGKSNNWQTQREFLKGFIVGLEYKKVISDLYSGLVGEEMTKFNNAADDATEKINEIIGRADSDYQDHNQKHVELLKAKKEEYDSFEKELDDFMKSCRAKKEALENTYTAHLKLSKPAEYWSKMENSYSESGQRWLEITAAVTIIAIIILVVIILRIDPFDLNEWAEGIRTTAFITMLITIAMFIIRFTSKMATSSFHLARDAKEREQLTYFYLALIKDGAVPEREQHLVISSLFSRADTGLLKGDSSPEMPSGSKITEK